MIEIMPNSGRTDAEILACADDDARGGLFRMVGKRVQHDVKPSYDYAWKKMSDEGKPRLFMLKTGSVGLGSVMMADGLYHMISGNDERVEDLLLNSEQSRNYIRMFAGACEFSFGATLAYLGATKGPTL